MNSIRKWLWRCAFIGVAILALAFVYSFAHPEPSYQGRKVSSWFHEAEMRTYFIEQGPASKAMREMGPRAVSYLARKLWHEDHKKSYEIYIRYYAKIPARYKSWFPEPPVPGMRRANAAMFLSELGPDAQGAFPDMLGVYNRAYCREFHLPESTALNWADQFAHPPVAPVGKAPLLDLRVRLWLLEGIGWTGGESKQTIPLLLAAMRETNYAPAASYYLSIRTNLIPAMERAKPSVLQALRDSDPVFRSTAVKMLGAIAPRNPDVIPVIVKATDDTDPTVRECALQALVNTPMELKAILPTLAHMLDSGDTKLHGLAVRKLISGGGGGAKFIGTLTDALDSPDPAIRAAAARALRSFSGRARHAVPKLTELTHETSEPDPHVREEAIAALVQINK